MFVGSEKKLLDGLKLVQQVVFQQQQILQAL